VNPQAIVLSGPPGAGKSSVGRALGERTGLRFVDLDEAISAQGRPVPKIIREDGEAAFRQVEAETLVSLPDDAQIIALGGGTLTTAPGRLAARARGRVLGLSANAEILHARLAENTVDRPLLSNLPELLAVREKTYAACDRAIDAQGSIEVVADRALEACTELEVLHADVAGAKTRVLAGSDLSLAARGAIAALAPARPVLSIIDRGVPEELRRVYLDPIRALFDVVEIEVAGGEGIKSWSFLGGILEEALARGCGRQSVVLAIGGGATCDLAALAASLLGRGAPLVLVPTTLLAQVDASIGGKAAVNMKAGRNLAGAFHPATDVITDVRFLNSLERGELASGFAELLKIALIADAALFQQLVARGLEIPDATTIARAISNKAAIVARDPYERGERKLLNLGHTLGHALESASDFSWRHGEAVAVGIAAICRLSVERAWMSGDDGLQIIRAIEGFGLRSTAPDALLRRCAAFLDADKKADSGGADIVALHGVGKVSLKRLSSSELFDLVRFGGGST
jgi:3-dehydroquinate synthetase